jgi:GDP-perosamine N-acetyltransferase
MLVFGKGGFGREVKSYFPWVTLFDSRDNDWMKVGYTKFNVAIGDPYARERISGECSLASAALIYPDVFIGNNVDIDEGVILCPRVIITCDTRIGKFFHANLFSYVGHDCVIGDFVTFSPSVCCNGNVRIGNRVFIGANASIRPGVTIHDDAIIGMGAVVVKDVKKNQTVKGNPAC